VNGGSSPEIPHGLHSGKCAEKVGGEKKKSKRGEKCFKRRGPGLNRKKWNRGPNFAPRKCRGAIFKSQEWLKG